MKRLISVIAVITAVAFVAWAGTRDEFKQDLRRSANNYQAYPYEANYKAPSLTPAPAGYEPFFINHYARHGSRWLIAESDYTFPVEALSKAEAAGKLTARGREVLALVREVEKASHGRRGELTQLGAEQHQGIARRMMENFPTVFAGDASVTARSTVVIRCILSMQNEINQLKAMNPRLRVTCDASEADMRFMNFYPDPAVDSARDEGFKIMPPYKAKLVKPEAMMKRLFTDLKWANANIDAPKLMITLFDVVSNLQSHHEWEKLDMYKGVFSLDDVYNLWCYNNMRWYIRSGTNPMNRRLGSWSQRNLLRDFITRADLAVARGDRGAAMRFGHEGNVLPFVCLMGLDGMDYETSDMWSLADRWPSYKVFPMACNVQMVFYRKAGSDDILVKILLNEHEATVSGLDTDSFPYYRWSELRDHFMNKLNR